MRFEAAPGMLSPSEFLGANGQTISRDGGLPCHVAPLAERMAIGLFAAEMHEKEANAIALKFYEFMKKEEPL